MGSHICMNIKNDIKGQVFDTKYPNYKLIRDALVKGIVEQKWTIDDALPTARELAIEFGVSVGVINKAIDLLVIEGLVERLRGRGVFVCKPQHTNSFFRFFRFKNLYDEQIVPESKILHRRVYDAPEDIRKVLRLPEKALVINFSRLRIMNEVPILAEEIWLPYYKFSSLAELPLDEFGLSIYALYEDKCGHTVICAEDNITAATATKKDAANLNIELNDPVLIMERIAYDYKKQPLEWRVSKGVASRIRYRIDTY